MLAIKQSPRNCIYLLFILLSVFFNNILTISLAGRPSDPAARRADQEAQEEVFHHVIASEDDRKRPISKG